MNTKTIIFILTVGVFFITASPVHAAALFATQGPTAAANIGTTGIGWSKPTIANALVVDTTEAKLTGALPAGGASQLLVLTGFNFNIPAGATIAGVAVSVTRRSTAGSGAFVRDAAVELVGGFGTSTSLATANGWPTTPAAATYGGASTLWGKSLTPAEVDASNFGLAIAVKNTDPATAHNAYVDGATVTVYYIEPDTTPPSIAAAPDMPGNEAASAAGAAVTFGLPSASDEGGIAGESCSPASGSTFALGSTTVTCTATDIAGNSASSHFDIGVVDTTPPVITLAAGTGGIDLALALGDAFSDPGYAAADTVDGTDTVTVGGDTVNTAVAGTYIITYNATDTAGNHAAQKTRIVTVLPAVGVSAQTITVGTPAPASAVYGSTFDVAVSADSGLPVAIAAAGACSGSGSASATITMTGGTGDCAVSYDQAGDATHAPAEVIETAAAQKAPLRLAIVNTTKYYGEEVVFDSAFSFDRGTSLLGSDTVTGITKVSAGTAATAGVAGSPYPMSSDAVGTGLGNYDITYINGSLTVLPAPLFITADDREKTYGDADPVLTYAHGALVGDDTEAIFNGSLARAVGEDAAAYAISQGTLSAGANYNMTFTGAEFTIIAVPPVEAVSTGGNGAPVGSYGISNAIVPAASAEVVGDTAGPGGTLPQRDSNIGTGMPAAEHPSAEVVVPIEEVSPKGTEGSAFNIEQHRQRGGEVLGAMTVAPPVTKTSARTASTGGSNIGTGMLTTILDFLKFLGNALRFR